MEKPVKVGFLLTFGGSFGGKPASKSSFFVDFLLVGVSLKISKKFLKICLFSQSQCDF